MAFEATYEWSNTVSLGTTGGNHYTFLLPFTSIPALFSTRTDTGRGSMLLFQCGSAQAKEPSCLLGWPQSLYYGRPFWFYNCLTSSFRSWLWKVRNLLFFLLFNYKSLFEQPLWRPLFKQAFVIENRACKLAAGTLASKGGDAEHDVSWSLRPLSKCLKLPSN